SVLGQVSIEGTASDPNFWKYELHYNPVPGNAALWTALPGSPFTTAVVEGELAVWDTTAVADGTYGLLLRVVRNDGNFDDYVVTGIKVVNTEPVAPPPAEEPAEEPAAEPTEEPAAEPEPEPEAETPAEPAPVEAAPIVVPFQDQWAGSAHADRTAEAFRHWDEDDPQVVSASCAKCHSEGGALDFFGADGSEARVVDADHAVNTVVSCVACHNEATVAWDTVVFPSGAEITGLGSEARCMECHQGRASGLSVDAGIEEAGLEDMDAVSEDLGFTNIHYFAAAPTLYGTLTNGGYEYEGKTYDAKNDHVAGFDSCVGCHNTHTLGLKVEECAACHEGVVSAEDFRDVRMAGSLVDYDGDGDMAEGIYYEIEGLRDMLYGAMQAYSNEVAGTPIGYESASYPYFFADTNGDGQIDEEEAIRDNAYSAWTGRLAKAAYNYQTSLKDPGAYAHGGKYFMQLLYDSIEDLNEALAEPVDLSAAHRIDHGHFAGSEEAFRHWDEDDPAVVSSSCSRCHTAAGLPLFATEGVEITQMPSNGLNCATCHSDLDTYAIHEFASATFPSGAEVDSGDPNTNLCIQCHQGRSSTVQVNARTADKDPDTVDEELGFINIHYFAAGATLFGDEVQGAYQYADKEYAGRNAHVEPYSNCTQCHSTHMLEVKAEECSTCHAGVEELADIRIDSTDYDGDGDTDEGIAGEIETMAEALYAAMQAYAESTDGVSAIVYDAHAYPYFFDDAGERYATWTPSLLKAAYNYQYAQKDPGAFAHNPAYVLQVLYDSIEDVGGDVSGMTRP
ncbi:MAG: cytochrome c3 family protein, partial [Anaerolineae bacterium]